MFPGLLRKSEKNADIVTRESFSKFQNSEVEFPSEPVIKPVPLKRIT